MNITMQKQKAPYNQKQTSANAFFPLMPSANEVKVRNETFEWMEVRYFLELQNPDNMFCQALSFICSLWKQITVCIATCARLFTETVQLASLEDASDLLILPCTSDNQKYFANINRGQAQNFFKAWEFCNLFSKEVGKLNKRPVNETFAKRAPICICTSW